MGKLFYYKFIINMKINELFEKIQEISSEDLSGEFQLHGKNIIWTYKLEDDCEEYEPLDDEDSQFNFECLSSEELQLEAYEHDIEKIEALLDEIEESDNWTLGEPDINDDSISFKIY